MFLRGFNFQIKRAAFIPVAAFVIVAMSNRSQLYGWLDGLAV